MLSKNTGKKASRNRSMRNVRRTPKEGDRRTENDLQIKQTENVASYNTLTVMDRVNGFWK